MSRRLARPRADGRTGADEGEGTDMWSEAGGPGFLSASGCAD